MIRIVAHCKVLHLNAFLKGAVFIRSKVSECERMLRVGSFKL